MTIISLHHITLICTDAQRTIDFYTQVLGLRLVKKTVNFDAPESYHLYFGDESKFELYATSKAVRPRVESTGGKALSFPDLADRVADDLYKERITIAAAAETLPLGNRAELRRWKNAVARMWADIIDG